MKSSQYWEIFSFVRALTKILYLYHIVYDFFFSKKLEAQFCAYLVGATVFIALFIGCQFRDYDFLDPQIRIG